VSFTYHLRNSLVAMGRYLTVFPGSMLHFNATGLPLKALPIDLPIRPRPVAIVKLKNRTLSPVAQLFIDCARTVARPLAKTKSIPLRRSR
jgi:DNA-binding transcriptional LysR family regulator